MSTPAPVVNAVQTPAPKLTAIQLIEQEIGNFIKQREVSVKSVEQAMANVHAVDGAIQGAQHLLAKLRTAAAEAEAEAKKLLGEAETEVKTDVIAVEAEAQKL